MADGASVATETSGSGWLCLGLLSLATGAAFLLAYLPSRERRETMADELLAVRGRIAVLSERIERTRAERDALAAEDPDAVREAIRETLREGSLGEYIPPEAPRDGTLIGGTRAAPAGGTNVATTPGARAGRNGVRTGSQPMTGGHSR